MYLAVFGTFAASKSEPLATAAARVHDAFTASGLGEPVVTFSLSDATHTAHAAIVAAIGGIRRISSVARVLKRFPELERFIRRGPPMPDGTPVIRGLSNLTEAGTIEPVAFATLLRIAEGVPKSFPFHRVHFHFSAPGFSAGPDLPPVPDHATQGMLMRAGVDIGAGHPTTPGISLQDAWWVNGRTRNMAALRIVEADPAAKKLPPPPAPVAAVLAACGKVRKTIQVPLWTVPAGPDSPPPEPADLKSTATGQAILAVLRTYRAGLAALAGELPHDLSPYVEDPATLTPISLSGPKKPELERVFRPMGYSCLGETGAFTLRRRTPGNLTVTLRLDVGTWSNSLCAFFSVAGLVDGRVFKATLSLPPSRQVSRGLVHGVELVGQFPIGGPARWRQLVENLAALAAVLDTGFVPDIEAAAGPSPAWFSPDSAGPGRDQPV